MVAYNTVALVVFGCNTLNTLPIIVYYIYIYIVYKVYYYYVTVTKAIINNQY